LQVGTATSESLVFCKVVMLNQTRTLNFKDSQAIPSDSVCVCVCVMRTKSNNHLGQHILAMRSYFEIIHEP